MVSFLENERKWPTLANYQHCTLKSWSRPIRFRCLGSMAGCGTPLKPPLVDTTPHSHPSMIVTGLFGTAGLSLWNIFSLRIHFFSISDFPFRIHIVGAFFFLTAFFWIFPSALGARLGPWARPQGDKKQPARHWKLVTKGSEGRWTMKIYRYLWLLWLESGKSYKYV